MYACVCVCENADAREPGIIFDSSESWGSSHNPAYRAAWSLVTPLHHPDSAHLPASVSFLTQETTEFGASADLKGLG